MRLSSWRLSYGMLAALCVACLTLGCDPEDPQDGGQGGEGGMVGAGGEGGAGAMGGAGAAGGEGGAGAAGGEGGAGAAGGAGGEGGAGAAGGDGGAGAAGGEGGAGAAGGEGGAGAAGGEGGAGAAGGEGGAGAAGGEGGAGGDECHDVPSVDPDHPMYDRFEGIGFDNACRSDDDCFQGGCSGEVCSASPDVASTCEGIENPEGGCGCVAGQCVWHVEECGPCADSDGDGVCDTEDAICGGNEILCNGLPPECRPGTVPEEANGCWTGRCVTWDMCGQAPCDGADADRDGTCDADDSNCNADGTPLMCRRVAPDCARGTVPEVREGCYTDRCVTWDQCGGAPCVDSDDDGICDEADTACNPEGEVLCDAIPPVCERGTVPVAQGGCWTGECTTWERCGEIEPICRADADDDGICNIDDSDCNADGTQLACRRPAPPCERGTVPEIREGCYTDRCVTWDQCGCADADNDGTCDVDDFDCNADGTPLMCRQAPPACPERGTYPEIREGCYTGACVSWAECGGAAVEACAPIEAGEFGFCRAIIGWGIGAESGACQIISGCGCDERCEGRVFETEAECQRACPGEPEPQFCGGIAGIQCRSGACFDDPRDNCAPPRGADCSGVCVSDDVACTPVRQGEFGDCEALIGVAMNERGVCVAVSGCGCDIDCAGRVFPDVEQCQAACARRE